jgi:hypothetical protein
VRLVRESEPGDRQVVSGRGRIVLRAIRPLLGGRLTNLGWTVEAPTVRVDGADHQLEWDEPLVLAVDAGEHFVEMNPDGVNPQDTWCWVDPGEDVELRFLVKRWRGSNSDRIRYELD